MMDKPTTRGRCCPPCQISKPHKMRFRRLEFPSSSCFVLLLALAATSSFVGCRFRELRSVSFAVSCNRSVDFDVGTPLQAFKSSIAPPVLATNQPRGTNATHRFQTFRVKAQHLTSQSGYGLDGKEVTDLIELTLKVPHGGISFTLVFIKFLFLMDVQHFNPRRRCAHTSCLTGAFFCLMRLSQLIAVGHR